MSEAENVCPIPAEAEQLDQSVCASFDYGPSQEKYVSNIDDYTYEHANDGAGLSNNTQVSIQTKLGDGSHVSSNCRPIGCTYKSSNHGQVAEEPVCDADFQSMVYETSQNIPIDNGNLQSELVKSYALASELSELQKECLSLPEKAAAERLFEHGHDGFYDFENKAVGESSKMPDDIVPGQFMDNSTIELSELHQSVTGLFTSPELYQIDDGDIQSEIVKPCRMVSEFSLNEQQKECEHSEKSTTKQACEHGHDGAYTFESEAIGGSSMTLDDVVPGQLMSNSGIEHSELKHSGGGIDRSPDNIPGGCTEVPNSDVNDQLEPSFQDVSKKPKCEPLGPLPDDKSKSIDNVHQLVLALQSAAERGAGKTSGATRVASYEKSGAELKPSIIVGSPTCRSSGRKERKTPVTKVKSEYTLRKQRITPATEVKSECAPESSTGRRRGRPRKAAPSEPDSNLENASSGRKRGRKKRQGSGESHEKAAPSEPDSNLENASSGRKRGRKKKQGSGELHDEFKRMRVHLRYLLHRIRYEQNLIDAYSSEGWRGQSLEKIRPEKELQRAKLDINRSKLKIRGLFQHLDAICAEGRFPKSLFDDEGLIDSEDIFCAKCGCRDLSPNNDIILCDGACDRGFHQLCLDPPLRTEEIPPGDEGWFCPACDCKFDCVELLNDSMGTKLSITQSWENVFSEAVAKAGSAQDDMSGLPSDDSEDNDYKPNGADDDNMEEGESSSDESDFSSASEDLEAIINNNDDQYAGLPSNNDDQYAGLPSDDPEDDDYDPIFVDAEDQPKQEGSSSDFTSASEDLNATIENDEISSKDERSMSPSNLVQDDDAVPVSGRRQIEKLDYKKLYDETYGNASNDSSDGDDDDDDWHDAITPKKRKNGHENPSSDSSEYEECMDRVTPKRKGRNGPRNASSLTTTYVISDAAGGLSSVARNTSSKSPLSPKVGVSNDLQTPETSSGLKTNKRQPYKRLGEEVIQRLYASFKENRFPDRSTKESLAEELGLLPKQVSKWFENTRWSVNHSGVAEASTSGVAPTGNPHVHKKAPKSLFQEGNTDSGDVASHGVDEVPPEASKDVQQNSHTNPRKKRKSDVGETSAKRTLRRSSR